ncbi:hypothetical protein Focb16_v006353 [Fusarium oxysporum f. sp. cubense]|uniref:FR47-like domain-containing protein n=1 Tax=Fusarium oxysporum f. sp. cubense TaxID=61366 RepID=A0A559LSN0_FUSOC|nr:hypothetical protein Focb16_v006353 [Fusarium oxysporum f. sp. cubense]
MWLYSTFEDSHGTMTASPALSPYDDALCKQQVMADLNEAGQQGRIYPIRPLAHPDHILIGSLNNAVRDVALFSGLRFGLAPKYEYDKFIFRIDELPLPRDPELPPDMVWGIDNARDCELVKSRTSMPRSLVHCEESFRRRGLAKTVSAKLLRNKTNSFGSDNLAAADVAPDNTSSQGMCKSLNGSVHWAGSW